MGRTPLHACVARANRDQLDAARWLLENGSNANSKVTRETLFSRLLLQHGATVTYKDVGPETRSFTGLLAVSVFGLI